MNFCHFIFENIAELKDKIAIFHRDNTITYSKLYSLILKIIGKIEEVNIDPNEIIFLIADNSIFFIASYFACIGSGRTIAPLHPDFGKENFRYIFNKCNPSCIFVQKKYWKRVNDFEIVPKIVFTDTDINKTLNIFNLNSNESRFKPVEDKKDIAVIIFTSGSTGKPKGVMLSHNNLMYNSNSIIQYLDLKQTDRVMVILPFSYCFGTSLLHTHFRVGGQVVINNLFMFPGKVLNEINEKQCTVFAGVPSVFSILLRRSAFTKIKFPTLRLIQQAGGKLTNNFIAELIEALPSTKIYIMYGQTEATARLSYLPPGLLASKLGSIGKGIPGTSIKVLNSKGEPTKPGEVGEIVASGGNIMLGYWQDEEGTSKVLKNGKLYTGDLGIIDDDGYIYLTDRAKEIIKSGGHRVSPKEIENYISKIKDIVEVAIIGIPDELRGEAIKAFVSLVPKSTITEKEIISFCKKNLSAQKIPKEVKIMKSLPKNISKKIDKYALKKLELDRSENN